MSYDRLRAAVNEAWEKVGRFKLVELIKSTKTPFQPWPRYIISAYVVVGKAEH